MTASPLFSTFLLACRDVLYLYIVADYSIAHFAGLVNKFSNNCGQKEGESMTKFAESLKTMRCVKGWTQGQLAESAGVTQAQISLYESGAHLPSIDVAVKMARALGVTAEDLMKGGEVNDARRSGADPQGVSHTG